jgi:ADP-heptose:LPS heptosyltransferase
VTTTPRPGAVRSSTEQGPERVLVLRALALGDLLAAVPALRAVRRALPEHRLTLATPAVLEPLAMLTGAVDEVVDVAPLQALPAAVARPDVAVNLHGRGPQSTRLLAALSPGRLLAFRHDDVPETADGPEWRPGEHEVARWCRMLSAFGIPADPRDLSLPRPDVELCDALRGVTVIHPGASTAARRWPTDRWALVARAERQQGRRVVVTGSPVEAELARAVADQGGLPQADVLAGRTDLLTLAALVADAGRILCGDTGVAHLASAFGTPSVVLFGPVSPDEWGPPPGPHRALWKGLTGDGLADQVHPGLLAIPVEEVLEAIGTLPTGPS